MSYNIAQANSATIKGAKRVSAPISFDLPDEGEIPQYVIAVTGKNIIKFGYCCETKGHIFPIFLKMNGEYKTPFYVGKEGMYEMQVETFQNTNDSEAEESLSDVIITEIMVPADIDFTLDYIISIN